MHATERRGRGVEANATETAAAANWSRPATAAAVIIASLRWPDHGRARKKRDPIEFSFHDFEFLLV